MTHTKTRMEVQNWVTVRLIGGLSVYVKGFVTSSSIGNDFHRDVSSRRVLCHESVEGL